MQCAKCGASIEPNQDQCARCGSFVDAKAGGMPLFTGATGIPLAQFTPSTQGPPTSGESYGTEAQGNPPQRIAGYRVVELTPQLRYVRPRNGRRRRLLVASAALVAVLIGAITLASTFGSLSGLGLLAATSLTAGIHPQTPVPTTMVTLQATATSAPSPCQNAVPDQDGARALSQAQLTTQLRNAAKKDYRPVGTLTTAHVGQQIYLTFRIATSQSSNATVLVCWPQGQNLMTVPIAAHTNGHYGQVPLQIPFGAIGVATAVLSWNNLTAAVVYFTVEP